MLRWDVLLKDRACAVSDTRLQQLICDSIHYDAIKADTNSEKQQYLNKLSKAKALVDRDVQQSGLPLCRKSYSFSSIMNSQ